LLSARFVLPPLFNWMGPSQEGLLIWSLCWCFLFVLIAEAFNLSPEIGAFLAGVSLAQLRFNEALRSRMTQLLSLVDAVFVFSRGVSMELGSDAAQCLPTRVISVLGLLAELGFFLWIMIRLGYGDRNGCMPGAAVAQISEF